MSAHCAVAPSREGRTRTGVYRGRRPERTVVYRLVQEHLETWLARKREAEPDRDQVAAYVERDFRKFLECGILARGFARARCEACGHDFLIAYSCKSRGVCGSSTTRRMAETAAHLVDHVVPAVPIRQWVFSLPKRLRYFLLRDAALPNSVLRIALREIERALRSHSAGASPEARMGGVVFIHRFGAMLNAHCHLHCCVIDGSIEPEGEGIGFRPAEVDRVNSLSVISLSAQSFGQVLGCAAFLASSPTVKGEIPGNQAQIRKRRGFVNWLKDERRANFNTK